jgi:hypothetical protein
MTDIQTDPETVRLPYAQSAVEMIRAYQTALET